MCIVQPVDYCCVVIDGVGLTLHTFEKYFFNGGIFAFIHYYFSLRVLLQRFQSKMVQPIINHYGKF